MTRRAVGPASALPTRATPATLRCAAVVTDAALRPSATAIAPRGLDDAVIYELHVGGFTRHPSSGVQHPGTFAGLIEKIPYLQELGVTHVELLPVMAFDEQDVPAAARGARPPQLLGLQHAQLLQPAPALLRRPGARRRASSAR